MVSQNPAPSSTVLPAHDARFLRYQDVLTKMSKGNQSSRPRQTMNDNTPSASEGWLSEDEDVEETKSYTPVKSDGIGPILGGFADADSVD